MIYRLPTFRLPTLMIRSPRIDYSSQRSSPLSSLRSTPSMPSRLGESPLIQRQTSQDQMIPYGSSPLARRDSPAQRGSRSETPLESALQSSPLQGTPMQEVRHHTPRPTWRAVNHPENQLVVTPVRSGGPEAGWAANRARDRYATTPGPSEGHRPGFEEWLGHPETPRTPGTIRSRQIVLSSPETESSEESDEGREEYGNLVNEDEGQAPARGRFDNLERYITGVRLQKDRYEGSIVRDHLLRLEEAGRNMTLDYARRLGEDVQRTVPYIAVSQSYCSLIPSGLMDEGAWDEVYEAVIGSQRRPQTQSTRAERAAAREQRRN